MEDSDKEVDNDLNCQVKDAEITDISGAALHDSEWDWQALPFVLVVVFCSSEHVSNRSLFCEF